MQQKCWHLVEINPLSPTKDSPVQKPSLSRPFFCMTMIIINIYLYDDYNQFLIGILNFNDYNQFPSFKTISPMTIFNFKSFNPKTWCFHPIRQWRLCWLHVDATTLEYKRHHELSISTTTCWFSSPRYKPKLEDINDIFMTFTAWTQTWEIV